MKLLLGTASVYLVKRCKGDGKVGKVASLWEQRLGSRPVGAKVPQHSQHSAHANPLPTFGLRVGHLLVLLPS